MKKIIILSLVALAFISCSNSNDDIEPSKQNVKLVDAKIGIQMAQNMSTRAYLGEVELEADNLYSIAHLFEIGDQMVISDYAGKYTFTATSKGQTTTIEGKWAEIIDGGNNGILAAFPASAFKGLSLNSDKHPVMSFTLPTAQETRARELGSNHHITYDEKAGLAFACAATKGANLWFLPVVSYLYFYSSKPTCTITSTQNIAGDYTVTYTGTAGTGTNVDGTIYNTPEGLATKLTYTASVNTITCTGKHIANHKNDFNTAGFTEDAYEYVICVKPGTYAANGIQITPTGTSGNFHNKEIFEMIPSYVYFLGNVDRQ